MKMRTIASTIAMSIIIGSAASCAQQTEAERIASRIDAVCAPLFPEGEPGAAVLVLKGDKVIFDHGYGIADLETGAPIDGDTFFNIASVSKQFTAVAALQLCERGILSLDTPVRDVCPQFTHSVWDGVTLGHLLSHSSGIPDARGYLTREAKVQGDEKLSMEYMSTLDWRRFEPGTAYEYINPTFVLAGSIVGRLGGSETFMQYVRDNIFLPAGMEWTLYFDRDHQELIPNMAHGYEYADVEDMPEERTAGEAPAEKNWYEYDFGEETFFATRPDGGIYTSTHEFVKWERALREGKVLSREMLQEAWTPHTKVGGSPYSDYQNRPGTWYGYGWFIEPEDDPERPESAYGGKVIYHTGDNGGFKILAARYPAEDVLVLVFANRADYDRHALRLQLEQAIFG